MSEHDILRGSIVEKSRFIFSFYQLFAYLNKGKKYNTVTIAHGFLYI